MIRQLKHGLKRSRRTGDVLGITLIEIIIAIVIIGISIPTIMVPFSGLGASAQPDLVVRGSMIAQKHIENISYKGKDTIACSDITSASPDDGFTLSCSSTDVSASDLDTSGTFATKLTVTVSHPDMSSDLTFYTLFARDE